MNKDKKKEINNFLLQLMKTKQGEEIMKDVMVEKNEITMPQIEDAIEEQVEEKSEKKKDKKGKQTWWNKKFNKNKLKKGTKVAIVYLRNNGNVDLLQKETRNGFFTIESETYHVDKDCVYTLTKDRLPIIFQREWDIIPLGTKKWEDEDMREKFKSLETHVLKGIRNAELVRTGGERDKGTITVKQAILWGLVALVGAVVFLNYV